MDDSSDFTFCKVDLQVDDGPLGSPKLIPNIKDITLQDAGKEAESGSQVNDPGMEKLVTNAEETVKQKEEQKPATKKAMVRAKVPFEKGYSQMDWLKITKTVPDLAGLKGQSNRRLISMDEVKQHKGDDSIWTVLKGRVYNITPYMKYHPGGVDMLMKAAGKDCTSLFNKYHAWVNAEFLLEKCLVGVLDSS